jgi:hypothetical protein
MGRFISDYTFAPARTNPSPVQGLNAVIALISRRWSSVGARHPPELHGHRIGSADATLVDDASITLARRSGAGRGGKK